MIPLSVLRSYSPHPDKLDLTGLTQEEITHGIKSSKLPDYIRYKQYLTDTNEALAQLAEMIIQFAVNLGLDPDQTLDWARKLQQALPQSEFDSWVATLLDGGPSIFMNTLNELRTTYPNGAAGVALVRETDPAKIYVWNGTAWEDFGVYQGIEIKDGAVTTNKLDTGAVTVDKTDFIKIGKNLLNPKNLITGKVYNFTNGLTNSTNNVYHLIAAEPNTDYTVNPSNFLSVVYFDSNLKPLNAKSSNTFTTSENTSYISVNVSSTGDAQLEKGSTYTGYQPFTLAMDHDIAKKYNRRGQLSSNVHIDNDLNYLIIPKNTLVKDSYTQHQTKDIQVVDLNKLNSSNLYVFYDDVNRNFKVSEVGTFGNETLIFIGSGRLKLGSSIPVFENYIGMSNDFLKVVEIGKNLFDFSRRNVGLVLGSGGNLVTSPSGSDSTHYIPVKPNTAYYQSNDARVDFYDENGRYLSNQQSGNVFETPDGCYLVRANGVKGEYQMEIGSAKTTYEPFRLEVLYPSQNKKETTDDRLKVGFDINETTSKLIRFDGLGGVEDVMNHYPFNEVKVCNISKTEWGATKITYENETGFSRDGSSGDVMVEISKFYFKRYRIDNYEYIEISGKQLDGFEVEPAFIENGKELNAVYVSAYDGTVDDVTGDLVSVSGKQADVSRPLTDYRYRATKRGKDYGLLDYRTVSMLQRLFMVAYADRNSQGALGAGISQFSFQTNSECLVRVSATNTNTVRVLNNDHIKVRGFAVNQLVTVTPEGTYGIHKNPRTVTNVEIVSDEYVDITFDGAPVTVEANVSRIYGVPQKTGLTDSISGLNGMSNYFDGKDGHEAIKFLGIENLWGNVWKLLDGIMVQDLVGYVGYNMSDYSLIENDIKSKYTALPEKLPSQFLNTQDEEEEATRFVKRQSLYPQIPDVMIPDVLGGGSSRNTMYSDMFYTSQKSEPVFAAYGSGIDHYFRGGIFTLRITYTSDQNGWLLCGARIQFKNI